VHDVPSDCLLRQVGIRVMYAKPSSTAVKCLWNSFGDNLTAKRRSLLNETLQIFVYTKMNHGPLGRPTGAEVTELGAWYFL
jgi:hypothetical protein